RSARPDSCQLIDSRAQPAVETVLFEVSAMRPNRMRARIVPKVDDTIEDLIARVSEDVNLVENVDPMLDIVRDRCSRSFAGRNVRIAGPKALHLFEVRDLRTHRDEQIDGYLATKMAQKIEANYATKTVRDNDQRLLGRTGTGLPHRTHEDARDRAWGRAG